MYCISCGEIIEEDEINYQCETCDERYCEICANNFDEEGNIIDIKKDFLYELETLIEDLTDNGYKIILMGDLNIHTRNLTGSDKDSKNAGILEEMVINSNLKILNGIDGQNQNILIKTDQAVANNNEIPYTR